MLTRREILPLLFAPALSGGQCPSISAPGNCVVNPEFDMMGATRPSDVIPWLDALLSRRLLQTGPFAGNYFSQDPTQARDEYVSFYFSCRGLLQYARVREKQSAVLACLNGCISSLHPQYSYIRDVRFDGVTFKNPDSTDAYAGVFLSLAVAYMQVWNDTAWWNRNLDTIRKIADANIVQQRKPNGLVRALQSGTPLGQNDFGLLMDQCEAQRGLADLGAFLPEKGNIYATEASSLAKSIHATLYDKAARRWLWNDGTVLSPEAAPELAFYPFATCQIFPEFFGVLSGNGDQDRFEDGYQHLNTAYCWQDLPWQLLDPAARPFPWLLLSLFAATKRGHIQRALVHLGNTRVTCRTLTMDEIGYARGILAAAGARVS